MSLPLNFLLFQSLLSANPEKTSNKPHWFIFLYYFLIFLLSLQILMYIYIYAKFNIQTKYTIIIFIIFPMGSCLPHFIKITRKQKHINNQNI